MSVTEAKPPPVPSAKQAGVELQTETPAYIFNPEIRGNRTLATSVSILENLIKFNGGI